MTKKIWVLIETVILISIICMISKCSLNKINDLEYNINAYTSEIQYLNNKNNELIVAKESLILSEKETREELELSKEEIKQLESKLKDKIAYISELEGLIDFKDTIWLKPDTIYINDGTIYKNFKWGDMWSSIDATVTGLSIEDSKLSINSLKVNVPLEVGLTDDYKIWAKTENPNIIFTNITGVLIQNSNIDNRRRRFHHGFSVGFGFQYGLFGKGWDFGPQFGYNLQYSF